MTTVLASVLAALTFVGPAAASPIVDWGSTRVERGTALAGEAPAGETALQLVSRSRVGTTFPLTSIANPAISGNQYAVIGQIRYESVEGTGYLEMWSVFADGGRYFTRTLAGSGPLARLRGTAGWRSFELPFLLAGHESPIRLELNVVLPGRGTVVLGPLSLSQPAAESAWWSERTAGLIGAILGLAIGLAGAAMGALAARGRARRLVLGVLLGLIAVGAVLPEFRTT